MTLRLSCLTLAAAGALVPAQVARAAQTDVPISMAGPAPSPTIHSPAVLGWNPNTPFLHTIAATGEAPLTYSAAGLPSGLSLDASTGIISGTMPTAGSYAVTVTASNSMGKAQRTISLVSGATLALTPPMGWNSYDSFGGNVTEQQTLDNAQALKTTMTPFGWNAAVIDFHWYDPEDLTDSFGRWLPSPTRFPSSTGGIGFKAIADKVHAMGLLFGIHIMRGIPQSSYKSNTPIANSTFTAQQAGNPQDTTSWDPTHNFGVNGGTAAGQAWYQSIFTQYASWGLDFVKVDDCVDAVHQAEVHDIRAGIDQSGRSIVLSLSPGPAPTTSISDLNANANQWRIVNDFWDVNPLTPLYNNGNNDVFFFAGQWQAVTGLKPGHWPDPDMLPLGQVGSRASAFSHNQQVTVMTLWSILPAPLIFGGETTAVSGDAWTTALLTNDEVLAIDQDPMGVEAKRIALQGKTEIWARDLSFGRKALALFNHDTQDAMVSVTLSQLGITGSPVAVRDAWQRSDLAAASSGISANVPHEGAVLYVLTPPGAGVPDAGEPAADAPDAADAMDAKSSGGQDGDVGAGSSSSSSSGGATSGMSSSGSSPGTTDGSLGGPAATNDSGTASAASAASAGERNGSSGCGCRVAGARGTGAFSLPVALFALYWAKARRRRRLANAGCARGARVE